MAKVEVRTSRTTGEVVVRFPDGGECVYANSRDARRAGKALAAAARAARGGPVSLPLPPDGRGRVDFDEAADALTVAEMLSRA